MMISGAETSDRPRGIAAASCDGECECDCEDDERRSPRVSERGCAVLDEDAENDTDRVMVGALARCGISLSLSLSLSLASACTERGGGAPVGRLSG
jgi:hypothetical protein